MEKMIREGRSDDDETGLLTGCMAVVQRQLGERLREIREEERTGGRLAGDAAHWSVVFTGG